MIRLSPRDSLKRQIVESAERVREKSQIKAIQRPICAAAHSQSRQLLVCNKCGGFLFQSVIESLRVREHSRGH
jgi:RNase P subunit RPR2